jgi:hypothetical protein
VEIYLEVLKICLELDHKCVQIAGNDPDIGDFRGQIGIAEPDLADSGVSLARFNLQLGPDNLDLGDIHLDR